MSEARAGGPPRGGRGFDRGGQNNRREGGGGRGGRGDRGNKPKNYQSKTPAIKDFIIDFGKPEHAAQLVKHKKEIIAYIRREGEKESVLIADALEQGVAPTIAVPPRPARIENPDNMGQVPPDMIDDEAEVLIWQGELKLIPSRRANLRDGLVTAFSIILDQCVPNLRKKLEQLDGWEAIFAAKDPIRLFAEITNIVQGREAHQQPIYSLVQGLKMLFSFRQESMSNTKFLEVQDALYEALVQQGCDLVLAFPSFVEEEAERIADELNRPVHERPHPDDITAGITFVRNRIKADLGLSGADNRRHKALKDSLENSYSCGRDEYPASPTHLLTLLENFRAPERHAAPREQQLNPRPRLVPEEGVNFAQDGSGGDDSAASNGGTADDAGVQLYIQGTSGLPQQEPTQHHTGANGRHKTNSGPHPLPRSAGVKTPTPDRMICCACGSTAHNLDTCPEVTDDMLAEILVQLEEISPEGTGTVMIQKQANKTSKSGLQSNRVYLDTCTTDDIMANGQYLKDIHKSPKPLTMNTNAGSTLTHLQGKLGVLTFWLCPHGIANVVSLRTLEKHFKVQYDSSKEDGAFVCSTPKGDSVTFKRCEKTGFPYIDLDDMDNDAAILMVQTVRENFEGFTRREVERAIAARKAQALAGHPSERVFKKEVSRKSSSSLFRSCPITSQDISNARTIFGPSVACARGKWVRGKSPRVEPGYVSIPRNLITFEYDVLAADVMFVCGAPFLITLTRKIRFVTVQYSSLVEQLES
jgi:hypothetical protein